MEKISSPPGPDEVVVLLHEDGQPSGTALKSEVHDTSTPLHLAFSCYLLDPQGRVLVTRRALTKRTWPGVWTNSFCGHPAPGESLTDALARRAREELGAEVLINYREQDFVEVLAAETGGRGVDVILDNMAAKDLERNIASLAPGGRLVIIGMQGGVKGEIDLGTLLRRNGTVHATTLRGRTPEQKAEICTQVERHVWPWIAAGIVRPVIDRVMPIADAADAHRALEAGDVTGKIVLRR